MLLTDYLDKGASLGPEKPCLTTDGLSLSYAETQAFSYRFARAVAAAGVSPGAQDRRALGQRSRRLRLRVRDFARRMRLVSDQPAQRGRGNAFHPRQFRLPKS